MDSISNYEKAYENIRPWLKQCDFNEAAPRLGFAPPADGALVVTVLGRRFHVGHDGVAQLEGKAAHVNLKSVIIWYLTYGGQGEPSLEFTPLSNFSSGIFGSRSADFGSFEWRKHEGLTLEQFRAAAKRIGTEFARSERYSETHRLYLFPKVPALLTYSEADDEFPAVIDTKFSMNAPAFLPFETLAVAQGLIETEFTRLTP
jgi:hypothetical protein